MGDVVRVDGQDGWWEIDAIFVKASDDSVDIDLHNIDDNFRWTWEIALGHGVMLTD
jgi:hypothetical protein